MGLLSSASIPEIQVFKEGPYVDQDVCLNLFLIQTWNKETLRSNLESVPPGVEVLVIRYPLFCLSESGTI